MRMVQCGSGVHLAGLSDTKKRNKNSNSSCSQPSPRRTVLAHGPLIEQASLSEERVEGEELRRILETAATR